MKMLKLWFIILSMIAVSSLSAKEVNNEVYVELGKGSCVDSYYGEEKTHLENPNQFSSKISNKFTCLYDDSKSLSTVLKTFKRHDNNKWYIGKMYIRLNENHSSEIKKRIGAWWGLFTFKSMDALDGKSLTLFDKENKNNPRYTKEKDGTVVNFIGEFFRFASNKSYTKAISITFKKIDSKDQEKDHIVNFENGKFGKYFWYFEDKFSPFTIAKNPTNDNRFGEYVLKGLRKQEKISKIVTIVNNKEDSEVCFDYIGQVGEFYTKIDGEEESKSLPKPKETNNAYDHKLPSQYGYTCFPLPKGVVTFGFLNRKSSKPMIIDNISIQAKADSDEDTMPDGWEYRYFGKLDLKKANYEQMDSDNDGLKDYDEFKTYKTSPINIDSDYDGMSDDWEVKYRLNPLNKDDANIDTDKDGVFNVDEYLLNTDPNDIESKPTQKKIKDHTTDFEDKTFGKYGWIAPKDEDGGKREPFLFSETNNNDNERLGKFVAMGDRESYMQTTINNKNKGGICFDYLTNILDDFDRQFYTAINGKTTKHNLPIATSLKKTCFALPKGKVTLGFYNEDRGNPLIVDNIVISAKADSDEDGVADSWEYRYFGDLKRDKKSYKAKDSDKDGLNDYKESQHKTNPNSKDSDGDGMLDKWEVDNKLNPLKNDANDDPDEDGASNLEEYQGKSDPNNKKSTPPKGDTKRYLVNFEAGNFGKYFWYSVDDASFFTIVKNTTGDDKFGKYVSNSTNYSRMQTTVDNSLVENNEVCFDYININPYGNFGYSGFYTLVGDKQEDHRLVLSTNSVENVCFPLPKGKKVSFGIYSVRNKTYKENKYNYQLLVDNISITAKADSDNDGIADGWEYRYFGKLDLKKADYKRMDSDNDKLSDYKESQLKTNPKSKDSDNDLIPDKWEVAKGLSPIKNDTNIDSDKDGVKNVDEYLLKSDPSKKESTPTKDKIKEHIIDFENQDFGKYYFFPKNGYPLFTIIKRSSERPGKFIATGGGVRYSNMQTIVNNDLATGGVCFDYMNFWYLNDKSNFNHFYTLANGVKKEYSLPYSNTPKRICFSLPKGKVNFGIYSKGLPSVSLIDNILITAKADSDNDGIADGWEYHYFKSLKKDQDDYSKQDSDNDGLNDYDESKNNTNPMSRDSDEDAIPDKWEVDNGLNPIKDDANIDTDKDGVNNVDEYLLESNPKDKESTPTEDKIKEHTINFENQTFGKYSWSSKKDESPFVIVKNKDYKERLGEFVAISNKMARKRSSMQTTVQTSQEKNGVCFDYFMNTRRYSGYNYFYTIIDNKIREHRLVHFRTPKRVCFSLPKNKKMSFGMRSFNRSYSNRDKYYMIVDNISISAKAINDKKK